MSFGETLTAGFDSVANSAKNITAPRELNARGAADLIGTINAIKQWDPDAKLTRAEIKALSEINAQKVSDMKKLFDAEAVASYSHENREEAKARKAYWEWLKANLDATISSYQTGLEKITIGTKEDLDALAKAHTAMLTLKWAPAVSAEGKKTAGELLAGIKDKLPLLNGTGLEIKVAGEQLQVMYTGGPKIHSLTAVNLKADGTVESRMNFPGTTNTLAFNNSTRIDIRKETSGDVIIEELIGDKVTSRITTATIKIDSADQTPIWPYVTKKWTIKTSRPLADVGMVSWTDFMGIKWKEGSIPQKSVVQNGAKETVVAPTSGPKVTTTESQKPKTAPSQKPQTNEKSTTRVEVETKAMLATIPTAPKDITVATAFENAKKTWAKEDLNKLLDTLGIKLDTKRNRQEMINTINDWITKSNQGVEARKQQESTEFSEFRKQEAEIVGKLWKKVQTGVFEVVDKSITFNNSTYYKLVDNQWNFAYRSNPDYAVNSHVSWKPAEEAFGADWKLIPKTGYNINKSEPILKALNELNSKAKEKGYVLKDTI
jgi:hypothetical protein